MADVAEILEAFFGPGIGEMAEAFGVDTPVFRPSAKKRGPNRKSVALRAALMDIVADQQPMTLRQVYYQATVRGLVPKTESGYRRIGYQILHMRRDHELPYSWISDNTRWMRKPDSYSSLGDMLDVVTYTYRRALWDSQPCYVEIWCEKDALAGVIYEETRPWDVPLMVSRGFSSDTYLYEAAEHIKEVDKPAFVYLVSDFDGAGLDLARAVERGLRRFAPHADLTFERVAVVPDQVEDWDAVSRDPKPKDRGRPEFAGGCVELDALPPLQLRGIVRTVIEAHIDEDELTRHKTIERAERESLREITSAMRRPGEAR